MCSVLGSLEHRKIDTSVPVVVIAPGYHGHGIARSLGRLGVPMYGVHADSRSPAAHSRYWRGNYVWDLALASPEESVDWLLRLSCRIGNRPVLIPTDDDSCVFLADHATELKEGFIFPNQPAGLTRALSSKKQMYFLCKEYAVPTAETAFPLSRDDVVEFAKNATFPLMLKGIDTLALRRKTGVKMVLVEDAKSLVKYYDEMETPEAPNLMVQEYFPGGSRTVWMFDGYFNEESECLFGLTANMIRQYPPYKGVTSLGECIANDTVAEQTKAFMKAIGYRGPLDLGHKYDKRSGQYKIIDVNPRIGSTFRLLIDNTGMDVARALYLDLTGQAVLQGEAREGRKWVVENFDLISAPIYCLENKQGIREWVRSYKGLEEAAWFARDDIAPFFMVWWCSFQWALGKLSAKVLKACMGSVQGGRKRRV